jgi:hypothetical protein
MEDTHLISILNGITNAKRIYRDKAAKDILKNPHLIPKLIDKIYDIEDLLHIKAAWVFELVCSEDITLLNPYIHEFINGMSHLKNESALRPVSKVCSLWNSYYFSDKRADIILSKEDIEQIIECNFDWLIQDHKVATQVFAMDTLRLWGNREEWIHQELKSVLQKNTVTGSSGYKAHARKLLKNL